MNVKFPFLVCFALMTLTMSCDSHNSQNQQTKSKIKVLIIDGENNHGVWPMTTVMMKDYLESSGLFEVDINRKKYMWQGPHSDHRHDEAWRNNLLSKYPLEGGNDGIIVDEPKEDSLFAPKFETYDVVVNNLGWNSSEWPETTKQSFESYMYGGGGLVVIHAADNAFGNWEEYNKMIGLGGWGGRSKESGPYVYYNDAGEKIVDSGEGACGSHGPQQDFVVTNRTSKHPITSGLPTEWMHGVDELYDRLRGPAENMTVLATAYSDIEKNSPPWDKKVKGTGRHEPVLMTIDYGEGRVFHSILGHSYYSMESVGFITTFLRGVEWAATGNVTQEVPIDFPSEDQSKHRKWKGNVDIVD